MPTRPAYDPPPSKLDAVTCVVSVLSLLGSAFAATLILPNRHGFYWGTAVFLLLVAIAQALILVVAVIIPILFQLSLHRLQLMRKSKLLLLIALLALGAEIAAALLIPVTGVC